MERVNKMRNIGVVLFVIGGLIAISSAAKMPLAGEDFPSTMGIFGFGLLLGIIGNVVWHQNERKKVMAELQVHKNDHASNPIIILKDTIPVLETLKEKFDSLPGMKLCEEIDQIQNDYLIPFADKRKTFMDILGTGPGAEVLLMIAYAERMINRVWSAQSDGYPEEARICLDDSIENYKKAVARMDEYLA